MSGGDTTLKETMIRSFRIVYKRGFVSIHRLRNSLCKVTRGG
jgi:hypothetical protein